jgi:hypothetical protein
MPPGLSYSDAVRLLGGAGPLGKAVDHAPALALAAEPVQRPTFVLRAYQAVRLTGA